jgi:hypothetical protein
MARTGRHRYDHLRAMRFALWAIAQDQRSLTPVRIARLLGISLDAARRWRADWFTAASPVHVEGIPEQLRPIHFHTDSAVQGGTQ